MLENIWFIAAVWMGLALIGSLISIRTGISVALIEILIGVVAGNVAVGLEGGTLQVGFASMQTGAGQLHHVLQSTEWTNFLALLGSGVLTFLAGAEIDPQSLKANWRVSALIGALSFGIPFAVVWFFAQFVFGWSLQQAQIAGIASWLEFFCATRRSYTGCAASRSRSLRRFISSKLAFTFLCRRFGPVF
jgi:Kef-type K+ transport system membrane component KefB